MLHSSKHRFVVLLTLTLVVAVAACTSPTPTPQPITTAPPASSGSRSGGGAISASGKVVPALSAQLGFSLAGRVLAVNVKVGDQVQAGDVLATLDSSGLEAGVAQAKAAVQTAKAQLAQLEANPHPAEIAAAEQAIKAAEAAVWGASAQLAQLQAGPRAADIAVAEAALAQAAYNKKVAQDKYDWAEKGSTRRQAADMLAVAQQDYAAAQKRLDQLKAGASKSELDAGRAGIAATKAQQAMAQARLDLLQAGATPEQIAVAGAAIAQAEAALQGAQASLAQVTLNAPFAGTITALHIATGEALLPGQAILTLADLSRLWVETTDLSERDIARVSKGQAAIVFIEALGEEITGQVVQIAPRADTLGGDVVYTVVIELDEQPQGLRWGMSADVEITSK